MRTIELLEEGLSSNEYKGTFMKMKDTRQRIFNISSFIPANLIYKHDRLQWKPYFSLLIKEFLQFSIDPVLRRHNNL